MTPPRWGSGPRYPRSRPRDVEGGIRAHSRRGDFGGSWWARRWEEVLDGFGIGRRLQRGKRYARRGQVVDLEVEAGAVRASVQGSRSRPYRVRIGLETVEGDRREALFGRLGREPALAARLLAGEMPEELEAAFDEAGVPLFPQRRGDLETRCTCPDPSNPCKHIAAVYLLLAEELDRDPWLLLRLRGVGRREVVEALGPAATEEGERVSPGSGGAGETEGEKAPKPSESADAGDPGPGGEERGSAAGEFWESWDEGRERDAGAERKVGSGAGASEPAEDGEAEAAASAARRLPEDPAALPRSLGNFPFWRGEQPLTGTLEEVYRRAREDAVELLEEGGEG